MDGARFSNAIASLGVTPAEITWQSGVDALCFGGTKNGMAIGEAILFFNRQLAEDFDYRCKQAGQLASKMRFITAPWVHMLENGAWRRHAEHANAMARLLAQRLRDFPMIEITNPVEVNSVFVRMPEACTAGLRAAGWSFYNFIGSSARLMTGWDSTPADIDRFCKDLSATIRTPPEKN